MSLPQSLPSLFGRFTAILKDHDHLGTTLQSLRAFCSALEDGQDIPEALQPVHLLNSLKTELRQHFGAEESEQYYGTVVAEEPKLELEIAALKSEHAIMLSAVDVLFELAGDRGNWVNLPKATGLLVSQLEQHEASESKLLRSFFLSNA